jgi:hypothetical protein
MTRFNVPIETIVAHVSFPIRIPFVYRGFALIKNLLKIKLKTGLINFDLIVIP